MRRLGKIVGVGLLGLVVTGMILWGMGVLYYSQLPTPLRGGLAAAFGLAAVPLESSLERVCPRLRV